MHIEFVYVNLLAVELNGLCDMKQTGIEVGVV
jgi:hypothetical protein